MLAARSHDLGHSRFVAGVLLLAAWVGACSPASGPGPVAADAPAPGGEPVVIADDGLEPVSDGSPPVAGTDEQGESAKVASPSPLRSPVEPPVAAPASDPPPAAAPPVAAPLPLVVDFERFRLTRDDLRCTVDDDCALLRAPDCCGCTAMGVQTAIRVDRLERAEKRLATACEGIGCGQAISHHTSCYARPKCIDHSCRMMVRGGASGTWP